MHIFSMFSFKYALDKSRDDCSRLAVTAEWQDLCGLQWVVGLDIENVGKR